jgi:hypothetical protein
VNTPNTIFHPNDDEFIIQSWLNISNKDPIVEVDKKNEIVFRRGFVKHIKSITRVII